MVSWKTAYNGEGHPDKAKREAAARQARATLQAAENRFLLESTNVHLKMDVVVQQLLLGKPTAAAWEEEAAYWTRFLEWTCAGVKYLNLDSKHNHTTHRCSHDAYACLRIHRVGLCCREALHATVQQPDQVEGRRVVFAGHEIAELCR